MQGQRGAQLVLAGEGTLKFWYWIDAEVSQTYTGYAYDGGVVEMSIDGWDWTEAQFDLSAVVGTVQFRFGSDGAETRGGRRASVAASWRPPFRSGNSTSHSS